MHYTNVAMEKGGFYTDTDSRDYKRGIYPLALDLNGDGVDVYGVNQSSARFDWEGDGFREATAWVGPLDGWLVIDLASTGTAGADGVIDQAKELSFVAWGQGGSTDLEALAIIFDSN